MKVYVLAASAVLLLAGCKSHQDELMDAQAKLSAARQNYVADCPNLDERGNRDAFGKPNHTPQCEDERKRIAGLQQQVLDAQRAAAK